MGRSEEQQKDRLEKERGKRGNYEWERNRGRDKEGKRWWKRQDEERRWAEGERAWDVLFNCRGDAHKLWLSLRINNRLFLVKTEECFPQALSVSEIPCCRTSAWCPKSIATTMQIVDLWASRSGIELKKVPDSIQAPDLNLFGWNFSWRQAKQNISIWQLLWD